MGDTVLAVSSRALLRACERLGLDGGAMLAAAGLDARVLEDPDARIELRQHRALWKKAFELSRDPDLALHAAEAVPIGAYKVLDVVASNAPTLGAGLTGLAKYFPLINTALEVPVEIGPEAVIMGLRCPSQPAALTREYAEYAFAAIVVRMRRATGVDWAPRTLELSHPAPASSAEHERIFRCPVRFAAPACRITIDRQTWDTPTPHVNAPVFEVLQEHASLLLEKLPGAGGLGRSVRSAIRQELRGGDPGLEHVAKTLGMSPRTLQRRLGEAGERYAEVLDELRSEAAKAYLADGDIALSEIAYLLGFSEQSSFTRAFRRWTGVSPSEYRASR